MYSDIPENYFNSVKYMADQINGIIYCYYKLLYVHILCDKTENYELYSGNLIYRLFKIAIRYVLCSKWDM
jgi:hypothetical protein